MSKTTVVQKLRLIKLCLIFCLSIFISFNIAFSTDTKEKKEDTILAKIGDDVITQSDLDEAMKNIPERKKGQLKDKLLDQLIEIKVFSKEAIKAGIDKDLQFKQEMEKATKEILSRYFIKKYIDTKSEPTEEEIKSYYTEHKDQYLIPEGVLIQEIFVKKKEDAEDILRKLKKGQSFENLVKLKSISPSWKNAGKIWIYKGRTDPELEKVAFNLEKEKLSDIIKTEQGYEIIKVLDKSDKREVTLEEAKRDIRYQLYWKKRKELMDSYYEKAKVDRKPSEKGVLFKIGDEVFKEEILTPILSKAPEKETEKIKHQWVSYLIETEVFSREAKKAGLEKEKEVIKELMKRSDEILANLFEKKIVNEQIKVSDKDIEDYYKSHQEEFREPLRVRVKTIVVKTEDEAKEILQELKKGTPFETLAKEKSIHESGPDGGELGWFVKGENNSELEKIAFSLDKDSISDIIKASDSYQIIKVVDRKGGDIKRLDEVKARLKMKIEKQKWQDIKNNYYDKARVKIITISN
ncbi:MAG: peptidyl-prolyl cis-trans isomerase [Thermodesulfovibrionales bacterium]